ncbi:tyrosine-type recombinase/integrase [Belliella pelovolcani]|uniref:Phage integrase family protein n=1 Tax=Belliella pelovolcani TaxID=529505 RepID=A0A1N7MRQ1_9BACT|nr:tyrosine-type recombinase/integrase [Belliella pelovolcani]SIS88806.1 Phage integrase family protein [Belliella pelovolcani]
MNNHFFFDGHKDNKDERPLAFMAYINGKLIKKRIGEKLKEQFFNQESQTVIKKYPEAQRLNDKLKKIEQEYYNLLKINPEPTAEDIGIMIKSIKAGKAVEYKKIENDTLLYWLYKYRDEKTNSESAFEAYQYTGKSVEDYEAYYKYKLTLDYIEHNNDKFRNDFVDFLKTDITINKKVKKANRAGTVVNKLEKINAVINYYNSINKKNIDRLKVNINNDNKADDREVSNLDINELDILYNYYINDKYKEKETYLNALGQFLLRCFTGLRFSELANLHSKSFESDNLVFYSSKTKKKIEIPLFIQAKNIAKKLNYKFPKFKTKQDKTIKTSFESTVIRYFINKYINDREITEYNYDSNELTVFKLSEKISSHSARKTFGTMIYNHTGNIYIASKFLHHSSIEDTVRYLGVNTNNLFDAVVDLKIGGESVINQIENKTDSNELFTIYNIDELKNIELIYSNISISLSGIYNTFNKDNKQQILNLKLDNKYHLEGSIFNLDKYNYIFNSDVKLYNDKKYIKTFQRGIYTIKEKGVD